MKVLKSIGCFVDWAVVIVLGVSVVVWWVWDLAGPAGPAYRVSWSARAALVAAGVILVALNVVVVWDFLSRVFGAEYLELDGGGRVSISIKALQEALERAVRDIPEVTSARVRVSEPAKKGKPVIVRAYVRLKGRVVYHSISHAIISRLETTFGEIVSEGAQAQCHVFWEKISADRTAPSSEPRPTGSLRPRFPVDEEKEA